MLDEQRALIESLKANLHRVLKWRFGPKSGYIDVDQLGLFVDGSVVVEMSVPAANECVERTAAKTSSGERRRAVRALRGLPRVIAEIDVPETQRICPR